MKGVFGASASVSSINYVERLDDHLNLIKASYRELSKSQRRHQRVIDLVGSIVAIIVLSPFMLLVAVLIYIRSWAGVEK
jgi:lipopolysaccharide/colanic/teichoic acid biosynthesis glycosyltransferase